MKKRRKTNGTPSTNQRDDYGLLNSAIEVLNAHPHQGRHLESGEYLPKAGNAGRKQVEKAARTGYEDRNAPYEELDEYRDDEELTVEPDHDDGRQNAEVEHEGETRTYKDLGTVLRSRVGNAASPGEFIATLLKAGPVAHRLHLQTRSFAAHSALDGLYKGLPGLVDDVVEAYQGNHGVITTYGEGESIPANDPASFVRNLVRYVKDNRSSLGTDTEIQNAVDEIASLLDSTLYKLSTLNTHHCPECGGKMVDGECEDCDYVENASASKNCEGEGMSPDEGEQTRPIRKRAFIGTTKNDEPIQTAPSSMYKGEGLTPSEYKGSGDAYPGVEQPIEEGGLKGSENDANFSSEAQRKYLWSQEPEIAESWAHGKHTSEEGPHRMPTETGKDVKGPQARESRKAMRAKMKAKATRNMAPAETAAQDPHQASKVAASASLHADHDKAFGHAQEAMRRSGAEDCKGAARKHIKAAEIHEDAATEARQAKNYSEADQHDHAAGLHRKAASIHLSANVFSPKMKTPSTPAPSSAPEEPPPSLDATIPPPGRTASGDTPVGPVAPPIQSGPTAPGPPPEMPPTIGNKTKNRKTCATENTMLIDGYDFSDVIANWCNQHGGDTCKGGGGGGGKGAKATKTVAKKKGGGKAIKVPKKDVEEIPTVEAVDPDEVLEVHPDEVEGAGPGGKMSRSERADFHVGSARFHHQEADEAKKQGNFKAEAAHRERANYHKGQAQRHLMGNQRGTETMTAKQFRELMIQNCKCEADRTAVADLTEDGLAMLYNAAKVKKETGKQYKARMEKEEKSETGSGGDFDDEEGRRFQAAKEKGYAPDQAAAIAYGPSRNTLSANAKAEGSNADITGKKGSEQAGGEEDEEELGQYQIKKNTHNPFDDEDEDEEDNDDMSHNQQTPITQRLTREELSVWNVAKEIEQRERIGLVKALVSNLRGEDRKSAVAYYRNRPIPELRRLLQWQGVRNQQGPPAPAPVNYLGAGAPALNVYSGDQPTDSGLDLPTMNYGPKEADVG